MDTDLIVQIFIHLQINYGQILSVWNGSKWLSSALFSHINISILFHLYLDELVVMSVLTAGIVSMEERRIVLIVIDRRVVQQNNQTHCRLIMIVAQQYIGDVVC